MLQWGVWSLTASSLPRGVAACVMVAFGFIFVCECCRGSVWGDYVNFQHELRENWSVREKLFELEKAFCGVCRIDKLDSVFIGFWLWELIVWNKMLLDVEWL